MVYFVHGAIGVISDGADEKKINVRKPYPKSLPLVPVPSHPNQKAPPFGGAFFIGSIVPEPR